MKGSEARNRRIVVIVVIALLVVAAEAGALYKMVSMILRGESPRQVQAQSSAEQRGAVGLNRRVGADEQPFGAKLPGCPHSRRDN